MKRGFTIVELIIVVAIIAVLSAIAVSTFIKSREMAICVSNLEKIEAAKNHWALANGKTVGEDCTMEDLFTEGRAVNYLKEFPQCSGGGTYTVGAVGTGPTCSCGKNYVLPDEDLLAEKPPIAEKVVRTEDVEIKVFTTDDVVTVIIRPMSTKDVNLEIKLP